MKDKEIFQDLLSSEQALASSYLQATATSSSPLLQDTLSQLLSNTLQNIQLIAQEMQTLNWSQPIYGDSMDLEQLQFQYQTKQKALQNLVDQTKLSQNLQN